MNEKLLNFSDYAKNFGIVLNAEQSDKFEHFERILKEYNSHTNLMSSNDINIVYEKHFADSIAFWHFVNNDKKYNILDIGSGGGFPVIPIAILLHNSNITALDATKKKTDFLLKVKDELGLKNLSIINARAEDIAHKPQYRENFSVVTSRAVGNLSIISELAIPFLKTNGEFLAFKSSKIIEEIKDAEVAIEMLSGEIDEIFEYELDLEENFYRNIIKIKKIKPTAEIYPRSFSAIKKSPIGKKK